MKVESIVGTMLKPPYRIKERTILKANLEPLVIYYIYKYTDFQAVNQI